MIHFKQLLNPTTPRHPILIVALASIWLATLGNLALWQELTRLSGFQAWVSVGFSLMIASAIAALLSLFAWRWTLKPVVTLFLFSAAFGAYFMLSYRVVIDATMMQNVLQTDVHETRDLLSWRLLMWVFVLAVLPCIWLWKQPVRRLGAARLAAFNLATLLGSCAVLVLTGVLVFQSLASVMRNHTQVRYLINPLNSFYALGVLAAKPFSRDSSVLMPIGQDAQLKPAGAFSKPPLLVLVLGETARSGNFAVNGYSRPTTPLLAQENIASHRNAWSCGTSTAASVPCMFSHLGRENFDDRRVNYEGLVDVLQHAGLAVLWLDNQSGCKGVCERAPNALTSALDVPGACDGSVCFDEVMLHDLDKRIAQLAPERVAKGVVVFMHQMGSHGPAYYKRSPAQHKKFFPECTSNALQQCDRQALINAYDNSIVYTDYFLSKTIDWLKGQSQKSSAAMIYVSDHGESLGENNLYLHGLPYAIAPDVQKRVPWISWLSSEFERLSTVKTACLKKRLDQPISHDNYFHSVLGILGVQTSVYNRSLDVYSACSSSI